MHQRNLLRVSRNQWTLLLNLANPIKTPRRLQGLAAKNPRDIDSKFEMNSRFQIVQFVGWKFEFGIRQFPVCNAKRFQNSFEIQNSPQPTRLLISIFLTSRADSRFIQNSTVPIQNLHLNVFETYTLKNRAKVPIQISPVLNRNFLYKCPQNLYIEKQSRSSSTNSSLYYKNSLQKCPRNLYNLYMKLSFGISFARCCLKF